MFSNTYINPDNPLARHSGAGRNPARKILREADNTAMLSRFRGELLTIWIPVFAGMTQFFLMDYLGLRVPTPLLCL